MAVLRIVRRWAVPTLLSLVAAGGRSPAARSHAAPSQSASPPASTSPTAPVSPSVSSTARTTCGGATGQAGPALDPAALPALPAEGVVVDTSSGDVLVGLDGTVIGHVPGYCLSTVAPGDAPGPVILSSNTGNRLLDPALDPGRSFAEVVGDRVPLSGGATLVDHAKIERAGQTLWEAGTLVRASVSYGRNIVTVASVNPTSVPSRSYDLRAGSARDLPATCTATDRRATRWYLVCGANQNSTIEALDSNGSRTKLAGFPVDLRALTTGSRSRSPPTAPRCSRSGRQNVSHRSSSCCPPRPPSDADAPTERALQGNGHWSTL